MSRSECYCPNYSCESVTEHIGSGRKPEDFRVSNCKKFRFEKKDNSICGGGVVNGCIEECPIRLSGEFQLRPYTKQQLADIALKQTVDKPVWTNERHAKRHAKKKGGKR